jgi:CRP-like cAMP-binding protein
MSSVPDIAPASAAVARLSALAALTQGERAMIEESEQRSWIVGKHREILREGRPVIQPAILLSGWAARTRNFRDGRRQILSFLLPGDLLGHCRHRDPLAATTVGAVTNCVLAPAPDPLGDPGEGGLAAAYATSSAIEDYYLFRQIARLGRLSAQERLADWMLETHDRCALAGLASAFRFPMPITQEVLADVLGLTSVHVNRTLQIMRKSGLIEMNDRTICLADPRRLAALADYSPMRVAATMTQTR